MTVTRHDITSRAAWLELRRHDVTASDVGALFGCHPYRTRGGLYYEKTGEPIPDVDNPVFRRGRLLENAVAEAAREAKPSWLITKANHYFSDGRRIGATPDFYVRRDGQDGVLQCKTVAPNVFRSSWSEDLPPTYIVLQALTEMMLVDVQWGAVAALVVDPYKLPLHVYEIPRHPPTEAKIVEAVAEFWRFVEEGTSPPLDYERDAELIVSLYRDEVPGKEIDLTGDNRIAELIERRQDVGEIIGEQSKVKAAVDAEIKAKLGDAEKALCPGGRVITWKTRKGYTTTVAPSRVLRFTEAKGRA